MVTMFPYGEIEIENSGGLKFKINIQIMKHYIGDIEEVKVVCDVDLNGA